MHTHIDRSSRLDRPVAVGAFLTDRVGGMSATAADIQRIARLAGIELSEERASALAPSLRTIEDGARRLAAIDYGDAEPAGRFRAPKAEAR